MNARDEWDEILEEFNLTTKCINSSIALKQIYIRFLDRYEKLNFHGEEVDRGDDEDDENRHKKWSVRALHSVPLSYNYSQHVVPGRLGAIH